MFKQIVTRGAIYAALNAAGLVVGLFALPIYARFLPPEAFGAQDMIIILATFTTLVAPLEVAQGLARNYADTGDPQQQRRLASTALSFTIAAELAVGAVLLGLGTWSADWILGRWGDGTAWLVLIGFVCAHGVYTLLLSQLRWRQQPSRYAATVVVQTVLLHGLGLFLIAVAGWSFVGLLFAYLLAYVAGCVVAFLLSREDYDLAIDRAALTTMLRFSVPLVPSSIAVLIYSSADRVVLRQVVGLDAVGYYAVLTRFAFVARPLFLAAAAALVPAVVSRHRDSRTPLVIARFSRYLWLAMLLLTLATAAVGPEVMSSAVTDRYTQHAHLLPVLAAAGALAELYVVAPGLVIANRTRTIALISVGAAIMNLALNVLLVPSVGIAGACIATAATAAAALGLNIQLSQRYYPIPYPWGAIGGTGLITLLTAATATWVGFSAPAWDSQSLLIRCAVTLAAAAIASSWLLSGEFKARA